MPYFRLPNKLHFAYLQKKNYIDAELQKLCKNVSSNSRRTLTALLDKITSFCVISHTAVVETSTTKRVCNLIDHIL